MAETLSHSDSDPNRKYSWWWDSHISPKNSKWLQENLTDMDVKVKQMIKLIEEDADSFARRAEMYYKKRPELMKLVEEFYRAYRALAERYDHATGVIRQAHRTMAEAFPNQVPPVPSDDAEAHTPVTPRHSHGFFDQDESERNGSPNGEPDKAISTMGLEQLNDLFMLGEDASHVKHLERRAKRVLNFPDSEETNGLINGSHDNGSQGLFESDRMTKAEMEILALKKALDKLESEKDAGLSQYQQSLERLSNLESEVSNARENSQGLDERASKAEAEVQTLKEALVVLQAEREVNLFQYQQCLEKISNLEKSISSAHDDARELNERAIKAETETESLKHELARLEAEKDAAIVQNNQLLDSLSKLEERLEEAEENARRINEEANIAKSEVEALKLDIAKLTEEKEDAAHCYEQCLEIISSLKHKLSCAEKEVYKLKWKVADEAEKLKSSEQKCLHLETSNLSLQSELQSLTQKICSQSEEYSEKQKELSRLWTSIQEERLHFVEAETAFQTLQNLHSKSQEDLRSLAAVVHNKDEVMKNMESQKQALEDEVHRVKEENKVLVDVKLSSSLSIKNLQDEISNLREKIEKLEQEVRARVDERNALQMEIYCLKEELKGVNKRHESIMEDVKSTGLDPQDFASSAKKLQDENSKLKEACKANQGEKESLLEKLEAMEKLLEKNSVLEISLSNLNAELQAVRREKVGVFEETCQSLLAENSTLVAEKASLISQLQTMAENLDKLSEKNKVLESSLFAEKTELQRMVEHLKIKYDEARGKLEDQASQILELSSENVRQNEELGCLCEVNQKLEAEMKHLQQELEKTKHREEQLSYELQKGAREIQQWETHAASLFAGLQISAVNEALLEGKVHELAEARENLERRSNLKGMESERLKDRVNELEGENGRLQHQLAAYEGENGRLQHQLAAYVPAVSALNDCITSLEMHTLLHAKPIDYKQSKVQNLANHKYANGHQTGDYRDANAPAPPDFQDMQKRMIEIEVAVKKMNESFNPRTEMREIQELKSGISRRHVNIQPSWHAVQMDEAKERQGGSFRELKTGKSVPDIPIAEIECRPKDIMLDQMAECSSYDVSRRGTLELDDQMLELWETANRDGTIGLKVGNANSQRMANASVGYHHRGSSRDLKNKYPSAHFFTEKDINVDKLEIPRSSTHRNEEGNRRKVLDKLDSDAQKLTNLEITVQDLIKRIDINEKSTRGKDVEYENVKEQLEAAQESITKLFDANRKLIKSVEGRALSSAGRSSTDSDEGGGVRRIRISARARRGSEKIGRLQLEVQRLQFLLLKLNEEKQAKGKTVVDDQNSKVLLRDYLYGQTRIKYQLRKKKKAHFCACIQPPTKGD
ncbi:hypothetical protein PIB30_017544 [Stylosanthes scabra]|uniref:NAB domain-containing protein n=1 Tax=Stylosanthes scabra TaxID=79078 RepID=A0ABU6S7E7_9FABA|nr:hypothetical protein [Stylosanthes scabra]